MIDHHKVVIRADAKDVFREMAAWGESEWWPEGCPMRYTRLTSGAVGVGTRYRQKVHKPFGPSWEVEVSSFTPGREISRRFLTGMFRGVERLYMIPLQGASEVHFLMEFEVVGGWNRLMWDLVFRKRHYENLELILRKMKEHLEGGPSEEGPDEPEEAPYDMQRRRFFESLLGRRR